MLTQFITNPKVPGTLRHNTRNWQITELMGGSACELLLKERHVEQWEQKENNLPLHECYPSLFLQGEAAEQFLSELRHAQKSCTDKEIDNLLLSEYKHSLQDK
jgi:hypothetical protein